MKAFAMLASIILVFSSVFSVPVMAQTATPTPGANQTTGELIVKLKNGKTLNDIVNQSYFQFLPPFSYKPFKNSQFTKIIQDESNTINNKFVVFKDKSVAINTALSLLKGNGAVQYVEPNYLFQQAAIPNDPLYNQQYYLPNMNAPAAWDKSTGSPDVVVAVIDSGVDYTHPDLAPNMWHDADGNVGYNFGDNNHDPMDVIGHGTHVSGVIGAVGNNGIGISGVNWHVKLMALRVVGPNSLMPASTVAAAITYAADHGAKVINMSFGAPYIHSQTVTDAIEYAWNKNVVLVASAGNKLLNICPIWFPANQPHVIAAGATDNYNGHPDFSCTGPELGLTAPSVNIVSTDRGGGYTTGAQNTGTSYSAAMVSGAAALVSAARPNLANDEIVALLEGTADDLGAPGKDDIFGYGKVNLARALSAPVPTITPSPEPTGPTITPYPTSTPRPTTTPRPTMTPYPTNEPNPYPTSPLYGGLSVNTNVGNGAFVNIGTEIRVCYNIPQDGFVTYTDTTNDGTTSRTLYEHAGVRCNYIGTNEPTGRHYFKITQNDQSAETYINVIPKCNCLKY